MRPVRGLSIGVFFPPGPGDVGAFLCSGGLARRLSEGQAWNGQFIFSTRLLISNFAHVGALPIPGVARRRGERGGAA